MKNYRSIVLMLNMFCSVFGTVNSLSAQNGFKIFLVGDAGDHLQEDGVLTNLQKELTGNPNSAVVFMGDNSYKDALWGILHFGFKGFDSTRNTMDKISSQLNILKGYSGAAFFLPGNHDWWNRTTYERGRSKLAMEESFIEKNLKTNTSLANPGKIFLPANGSYGPEYVELNHQSIRLIFIDTYRIIQTGIKKRKVPEEEETFYDRLNTVIDQGYALKEKIIVLAHHPVYSMSPFNRVLKHPYIFRRIKASSPGFPSYKAMSVRINSVLLHYPGIYYASGHLHALQYFYKDSIHYIISGAGSKEKILNVKDINKYNGSLTSDDFLQWNSGGFFELEFNDEIKTTLHYENGLLKCVLP